MTVEYPDLFVDHMYVYFFYKPLSKHGAMENQKHGKKMFRVLATRAQKLTSI
jgi:hypothetical protein